MNNTNAIYIDLTAKSGATLRAIVVKKDAPDGAPTIEFFNVDAATSKPVAAISQAAHNIAIKPDHKLNA